MGRSFQQSDLETGASTKARGRPVGSTKKTLSQRQILRREKILEAAISAFSVNGYQRTGVADIAGLISIGHGTFYRYFPNKRAVFEAVIDRLLGQISSALLSERPDSASNLLEYTAQLERIGDALFSVFMRDPNVSRIVFYEVFGVDVSMIQKVQSSMEMLSLVTQTYLQNGVAKGFVREDRDLKVMSKAINGMIFEGIKDVCASKDPEQQLIIWKETIVTLITSGVAKG